MSAPADLLVHLRRARDHADRHYTEPLELEQLAAVAGISKYHFQRLFRATYGRSPSNHLPLPGVLEVCLEVWRSWPIA